MKETEGIELDPVYTGKAMAALLDEAVREEGVLLFWETYNANDMSYAIKEFNIERISKPFRRFYETEAGKKFLELVEKLRQ